MQSTIAESDTFFLGHWLPAQSVCCGLLSLRTGVHIVLILDLFLGFFYVFEFLLLLSMLNLVPAAASQLVLSLISNTISIVLLPFAVCGLTGIFKAHRNAFGLYFRYKVFEVVALFFFWPVISHQYCNSQDYMCQVVTFSLVIAQKALYNSYSIFVIWSAEKRWDQVSGKLEVRAVKLSEEKEVSP